MRYGHIGLFLLPQVNYLDLAIAVPLLWGAINGFRKGLIIEVASLLALVAGIFGAAEFSVYTGEYLSEILNWSARAVQMTSFVITFIAIVLIVHLMARVLRKLIKIAALGIADRLLGILFGIIKYLVLVSVVLFLVSSFDDRYHFISSNTLEGSVLYHPLVHSIKQLYPQLGMDLEF